MISSIGFLEDFNVSECTLRDLSVKLCQVNLTDCVAKFSMNSIFASVSDINVVRFVLIHYWYVMSSVSPSSSQLSW